MRCVVGTWGELDCFATLRYRAVNLRDLTKNSRDKKMEEKKYTIAVTVFEDLETKKRGEDEERAKSK